MFFNSSFTVSMMARFLSSSLSDTLIKAPFMLFFKFGNKLYAVHETYACTFPKQYLLDEQSQRYGNFLFKFHETVV